MPPKGGGSYPGVPMGPQESPGEDDPQADLRRAAVITVLLTVAGVALGVLWLWLAPRVPLVSDNQAVFLKDSEGEEAIGADGTFVLLALAFGAVTAALVFWIHRRGGIPLVAGLALGGLLGSLVAWGSASGSDRSGMWSPTRARSARGWCSTHRSSCTRRGRCWRGRWRRWSFTWRSRRCSGRGIPSRSGEAGARGHLGHPVHLGHPGYRGRLGRRRGLRRSRRDVE